MAKIWTPEEVKTKVAMLTQPGSPYVTNYPNVEEMVRRNSVAEEWSDDVLRGVVEKGPMYETLPKVCAEILSKREEGRRWQVEEDYRVATARARTDQEGRGDPADAALVRNLGLLGHGRDVDSRSHRGLASSPKLV